MKKLIYCDLFAFGGVHSGFNVACLQVLLKSFSRDYAKVEFSAEREHADLCARQINDPRVRWRYSRFLSPKMLRGYRIVIRDFLSCWYVLRVFLTSRKSDLVFFSIAYPIAQYCICFLRFFIKRNVWVCHHGELDALINVEKAKKTKYGIYYSMIRPVLRTGLVKRMVLGQPIYNNVKHLFGKHTSVIVIDHPYVFDSSVPAPNLNFSPLVVGQVGRGDRSKGTHYLFALAKLLEKEICSGILKIRLVGKLEPSLKALDNGLVEYSDVLLSNDELYAGIQSLHYTLQLRDATMGRAIASGSFFDTLKYEKPFLSLDSEYINYYQKHFPSSGISCCNIEEMAESIRRILSKDQESLCCEYKKSIQGVRFLKDSLSLDRIAEDFLHQYRNV